jgi:hypothetical protein
VITEGEGGRPVDPATAAQRLVTTRNMKLKAWSKPAMQCHGDRFASHPVLPFLVFNMGSVPRGRAISQRWSAPSGR